MNKKRWRNYALWISIVSQVLLLVVDWQHHRSIYFDRRNARGHTDYC